jgi:ATP-binding cassette subfamily C protein CydC
MSGETVRGLCAVVAQQTHLFNMSIRDNLLLARPGADENDLAAALESASLLDEVMAMRDGLDTIVGETGTRLSGGQARRLSIARAFMKDAPILILDEPTEGLDAASERAVLDALARLRRGRTTLLITHHSQALRIVDAIVTLERGRVARAEVAPRASKAAAFTKDRIQLSHAGALLFGQTGLQDQDAR